MNISPPPPRQLSSLLRLCYALRSKIFKKANECLLNCYLLLSFVPWIDSPSPEHRDGESIQGTKDSSNGTTELRNQVNDQDQTSTRNGDDSYDKSKSVLIIGDSIIKHIDPRKHSKKSVYKRSFPGKRIEEIHDEIDNIHLNVEPSHVIIHAGTNNLPSEGADSCARKLQKLARDLQSYT